MPKRTRENKKQVDSFDNAIPSIFCLCLNFQQRTKEGKWLEVVGLTSPSYKYHFCCLPCKAFTDQAPDYCDQWADDTVSQSLGTGTYSWVHWVDAV